ncbi:unnamed protein product [Cuscuta campestris]|uniref:Uncharacterized protein n=1 Tax=Cuscuta campestris TaxID=132261 RepID=A0A484M1W1_9ASTE|nr:unnamed protein product [Cuscuta campestris]
MENTGASSGFQYKRRRILTQTQREEMENENQISAEVTPSVEGQSFLDASEIEVPALACTIDIDKIPGMKLTLKSSLGEFQNLMGEGLGDHPEVLDLFRESTPFSHFLDVECIPPPLFLWQLIAREAKIKRKGEMWFVFKGVPAESTHETMGTEDATSMKPLQEMVESCHEVMETDAAAASMKPLQAESTHETMGIEDAASMKPLQKMVEPSHEVMETDAAASMKTLQDKRVKKKSSSLKSPYTADVRKKKKADELLSKPPTKADLLEFKSFIVKAIKDDRPVQCYLAQYKEIQDFVKTF